MKILNKNLLALLMLFTGALFSGCNKNDFLSKKPSTAIDIPSDLSDFQALLDYDDQLTESPALGELSSDEYYLTTDFWQSLFDKKEINAYIWASDTYQGEVQIPDWDFPYQEVFYANTVLDGLAKLPMNTENQADWQRLKGWALFMRGYAFHNLAQIFAPTYDSASAGTDLGIPLRLSSDIGIKTTRPSVQQDYDQIISDLTQAAMLLPVSLPPFKRNQPCRPAAMALLARVYLSARNYSMAKLYSDSCLLLYDKLIDYNSITLRNQIEFAVNNDETLYQSKMSYYTSPIILEAVTYNSEALVDSTLFSLYSDPNDLRPQIFFSNYNAPGINLNGLYNASYYCFAGLATDEVYLIRAECLARAADTIAAMADLNHLLSNRWVTGTFVPLGAGTVRNALSQVLIERRKELIFRGTRWSDLRRLNKEGYNITLHRTVNGQDYTLAPNSPLYVLPIPPDVIALTGVQQNQR